MRDVITEEDGDTWEAAAVNWCLIVLHPPLGHSRVVKVLPSFQ